MFKKVLFCLLSLFFISDLLNAQDASIKGVLSIKKEPVGYGNVVIKELNKGTYSNEKGFYTISNLEPDTYTIVISSVGYRTLSKTIQITEGVHEFNFEMEEDPLNLDRVVVSASRNEQFQYRAPVIVSQVTDQTFESTQALALSEGLNFSPGLRVENNCQNCGFTQVRMNGLGGAYSQILINSRPVFSALAGVYGLDMIPTNMIDRVEVVRGGGSALYGGNAIAGTINIITKDPINNSFQIGVNQALTNFQKPDRTLFFNGSIVNDQGNAGINLYGYNREREPWDANGDGFSEIVQLNNTTFGMDAFYKLTDRDRLELNLYSINEYRRGGNKFELEPHQTDITEELDHNILGVGLSYEHFSKNLRHKLAAYASLQSIQRHSYYGGGGRVLEPGDSLTEADILAINAYGKSNDLSAIGGLLYTYVFSDELNISLGSEAQFNTVEDQMPGYNRQILQELSTIGNFAQAEWKVFKDFTVLAGLRYDMVNINGDYNLDNESFLNERNFGILVPRLSAMYQFNEYLRLRASYAQGYRAPQAFDEDLHIETVGGAARFVRLDPELRTEFSDNYNLSLNYSRNLQGGQLNIVVEAFRTELQNAFILSEPIEAPGGTSIITKRNSAGSVVQGFNLEANLAIGSKFVLQSGATIQEANYKETETIWESENENSGLARVETNQVLRTPNLYGYFNIQYNLLRNLDIFYSGIITGSMEVPHVIDPETEYTVLESTPSFFENTIKLNYKLKLKGELHLELFAGLQNIFNAYQDDFDIGAERDAGYVYGPARPRTLFSGLKFCFN